MACCAFAIFLVMQLLRPFRAIARRIGLLPRWRPDAAVEWRPGTTIPRAAPRRRWRGAVALLAFGSLAAVPAAASQSTPSQAAASVEAAIHASICGPLGWRD